MHCRVLIGIIYQYYVNLIVCFKFNVLERYISSGTPEWAFKTNTMQLTEQFARQQAILLLWTLVTIDPDDSGQCRYAYDLI